MTITESYLERSGAEVLLRLAVHSSGILDILTDDAALAACRGMLRSTPGPGMHSMRLGSFGPFEVTMTLHGDHRTVSIFVDGPELGGRFSSEQGAGVYVARDEMLRVLDQHLKEIA